jgi:predicted phage terminase large subunit-like protein
MSRNHHYQYYYLLSFQRLSFENSKLENIHSLVLHGIVCAIGSYIILYAEGIKIGMDELSPFLKQRAFEEYKEWNPDSLIVEAKAAGTPLLFELRAMGVPVQEFTPSRGNDKIARLNAVADLFASGRIWVPNTHWAEELVEEVASFPSGEHDDLVDSMTQALLRYRRGGFLRLASDEEDPVRPFKSKRARLEGYY